MLVSRLSWLQLSGFSFPEELSGRDVHSHAFTMITYSRTVSTIGGLM